MEEKYTTYEVIKKLLGAIEPVGDSSRDKERLKNIKNTIILTEKLIDDIIYSARNKDSYEHSVKEIGNEANAFITRLKETLS